MIYLSAVTITLCVKRNIKLYKFLSSVLNSVEENCDYRIGKKEEMEVEKELKGIDIGLLVLVVI